jgi:photosystem II stability/assembly factor-like uncharacterized protein
MSKKRYFIFLISLLFLIVLTSFAYAFPSTEMGYNTFVSQPLRNNYQASRNWSGGEGEQAVEDIDWCEGNSSRLYLVVDTMRVWRSDDSGNSWFIPNRIMQPNGGMSIACDPKNSDVVFADMGLGGISGTLEGIYRSLDGGLNWTMVLGPLNTTHNTHGKTILIDNLSYSVNYSQNIYVGTYAGSSGGVYKSTNGGDTWTLMNFSNNTLIYSLQWANAQHTAILVGTNYSTIYYLNISTNRVTSLNSTAFSSEIRDIAVDKTNYNNIWVTQTSGVNHSTDGGNTWSRNSTGLITTKAYYRIAISRLNGSLLVLGIDGTGGNLPYWTENGGNNWNQTSLAEYPDVMQDGYYYAKPTVYSPINQNVVITEKADNIRISYDKGYTWNYSSNGYAGARMQDMLFINSTSYYICLTDYGVYKTDTNGYNFSDLNLTRVGSARSCAGIDGINDSYFFVSSGDWGDQDIFRWNGTNWINVVNTTSAVYFIHVNRQNNSIVYAQNLRSNNSGVTWFNMTNNIVGVGVNPNNSSIIYGVNKSETTVQYIFKSTDGGMSWVRDANNFGTSAPEYEICVSPFNDDYILAPRQSAGVRIYNGATWTTYSDSSGLLTGDNSNYKWCAYDTKVRGRMYVGKQGYQYHSTGISQSDDYGVTWYNITSNIGPYNNIYSIKINPFTNELFLDADGLYKMGLENTTTYYISNSGDDGLAGTSEANAWKTLTKITTSPFNSNDIILLKRGDTFRESISFNRNHSIFIGAYGIGNKPKIWGSYNMSSTLNWTYLGGNKWIGLNNSFGRSTNWSLWYNTNNAIANYGRNVTTCNLVSNWDWCYNNTNKTIMIYLDSGNPGTYGNGIEVPELGSTDYFWTNNEKNNISYDNLEFSYCLDKCFLAYRGNNTKITNCDFKYSRGEGVYLDGTPDMATYGNDVINSTFTHIGYEGLWGGGENIWIYRHVNYNISNNIIKYAGGVPINTRLAREGLISRNNISDCDTDPSDFGHGIYLDGTNNTIISNNIVNNCTGGFSINAETNGTTSNNNSIIYNLEYDNYISLTISCSQGASCLFNNNVSHNTFVRKFYGGISGMQGQLLVKNYTNLTFQDNVIYNDYTNLSSGYFFQILNYTNTGYFTSNYNLYYSLYNTNWTYDGSYYVTLASYIAAKGKDTLSQNTNPLFYPDTYTPTSYTACTMSSTGSYVGALPCSFNRDNATIYVSNSGDDSNSGTDILSPIKTITKLNTFSLYPGTNVLFNRGDLWRSPEDAYITVYSGNSTANVTYGSYGTGNKPRIYGSINASSTANWSNTTSGNPNIWNATRSFNPNEVSNIVYNESFAKNRSDTFAQLDTQGEFFYNATSLNFLYVYSVGNPASVYSSINVVLQNITILLTTKQYVIVKDLDLRYSGKEVIGGLAIKNTIVQNNTIQWGGGKYVTGTSGLRMGDCVSFELEGNNNIIRNNDVSNCADSCLTTQAYTSAGIRNITNATISYNSVSNCPYGIVIFSSNESNHFRNVSVDHNTFINIGNIYANWSNVVGNRGIRIGYMPYNTSDFNITNNIFHNYLGLAIDIGDDTTTRYKGNKPNINYNLYGGGTTNIINYNMTELATTTVACINQSFDCNGNMGNPLFYPDTYTPTSYTACTMSTTGSYVGALPCSYGIYFTYLYVNQSNPSCSDSYTRAQAQNIATPWCSPTPALLNVTEGDTVLIANGRYNRASTPFQFTTNKVYAGGDIIITNAPGNNDVIFDMGFSLTSWVNLTNSTHNVWNGSYVSSATDIIAYNNITGNPYFQFDNFADLWNLSYPEGTYWDNTNDRFYIRFNNLSTNASNYPLAISRTYGIQLQNVTGANIKISNITIRNALIGVYMISNTANITLENMTIQGGKQGVRGNVVSNISILNSKVYMQRGNWTWENMKGHQFETSGIYFGDSLENIKVNNTEVYGHFNGIYAATTTTGKLLDLEISYNTIHDIYDDSIELELYGNGYKAHHNIIYDAFVGFALSSSNSKQKNSNISYNIIDANKNITSNNTPAYETGECFKLLVNDAVTNYTFDHNTCIGRGIYAYNFTDTQRNTTWTNNIFYSNSSRAIYKTGLPSNNVSYNNNLYYRVDGSTLFQYYSNDSNSATYTSLALAKAGGSWNGIWDTLSQNTNPLFYPDTYTPTSYTACTMSSTGSYVGALPCTCIPLTENRIISSQLNYGDICTGEYRLNDTDKNGVIVVNTSQPLNFTNIMLRGNNTANSICLFINVTNYTISNLLINNYSTSLLYNGSGINQISNTSNISLLNYSYNSNLTVNYSGGDQINLSGMSVLVSSSGTYAIERSGIVIGNSNSNIYSLLSGYNWRFYPVITGSTLTGGESGTGGGGGYTSTVNTVYEIYPSTISFTIKPNEKITKSITIVNKDASTLKIISSSQIITEGEIQLQSGGSKTYFFTIIGNENSVLNHDKIDFTISKTAYEKSENVDVYWNVTNYLDNGKSCYSNEECISGTCQSGICSGELPKENILVNAINNIIDKIKENESTVKIILAVAIVILISILIVNKSIEKKRS